jgi:hypothetical protein
VRFSVKKVTGYRSNKLESLQLKHKTLPVPVIVDGLRRTCRCCTGYIIQDDKDLTCFPKCVLSLLLVQLVELLDQRATRCVRNRRYVVAMLLIQNQIFKCQAQ